MKKLILLFILFPILLLSEVKNIQSVEVQGLNVVKREDLDSIIKAKPGNVSKLIINQDIKDLYEAGYFSEIKALVEKKTLIYQVLENPVVNKVYITGNKAADEEDLSAVLDFKERSFISKYRIRELMEAAKIYYQSLGYYDASFDYSVVPFSDTKVDVHFKVTEGKKYKISEVKISGLKELDESDILSKIQTMPYKWWSSWLFGTGRVNQAFLKNDRLIIQQHLFDNGYINSQISDAEVYKDDGYLVVVFNVVENEQYLIGNVSIQGDLIDDSKDETLDGVETKSGEVFNASRIREDSFLISDKFADIGYAFANVIPNTSVNQKDRTVNIDFSSNKGQRVNIREIHIRGNEKTYDRVIRRELKVYEQEQYTGKLVKRSEALLRRLGYFDEVSINRQTTDIADQVDLLVDVKEGPTGSFTAGAGVSSSDGALFTTRLSERNFLGTGKRVEFNVDVGDERDNIIISYDDRRFNDSYWALGLDGMKRELEFEDFDRQLTGASLSFGYPFEEIFREESWLEDIHFSIKYEFLNIDINNVDPEDAAPLVIASEGTSRASSIIPRLFRNTIDNPLRPTDGSRQVLSFEYAGPGGNEEFYLIEFRNQWYEPLIEFDSGSKIVFSWRTRINYGDTLDGDTFPLFRRFFPGGINSVRGFKRRTLGPTDADGNEFGGSKQFINNLEIIFPLSAAARLDGVIFFDMGEAFDDNEDISFSGLRKSYGYGVRWNSPIAPIRIEIGYPLDPEADEDSVVTSFSLSAPL